MNQWLKTVSAGLCILTILLHLVPNGKFTKYVRFYAGLLFFLMAAEPVLGLFTGDGELERMMQLEFLKEDYYNLETSISNMEELKNDTIEKAYQQEIQRQIQSLVSAYGLSCAQVYVEFDKSDGYVLKKVMIECSEAEAASMNAACQEIAGVYQLALSEIQIINGK